MDYLIEFTYDVTKSLVHETELANAASNNVEMAIDAEYRTSRCWTAVERKVKADEEMVRARAASKVYKENYVKYYRARSPVIRRRFSWPRWSSRNSQGIDRAQRADGKMKLAKGQG